MSSSVEMNPFLKLVRMLEQRLARQNSALADTQLQLEGARKSADDWQKDWVKKAGAK